MSKYVMEIEDKRICEDEGKALLSNAESPCQLAKIYYSYIEAADECPTLSLNGPLPKEIFLSSLGSIVNVS